jgi:hypothetical protein
MRGRLLELLPLLLAGVVLLVFQLSHLSTPLLQFLPLRAASPTPSGVAEAAGAAPPPTLVPSRRPAVATATVIATRCNAVRPRFMGGMAGLKNALGDTMGDPTECEHAVTSDGDTQQKTSTGLAYYEHKINVACFTTGWDHWGLTDHGLVHWTGEAVDPPSDALPVAP